MTLAIFDLDNTLLGGDSDHAWGEFLVQNKLVDAQWYQQKNDDFYRDYQQGNLDMFAYQSFVLSVLADNPLEVLHRWSEQFLNDVIRPMILPKGVNLIKQHKERGDHLLIITATNDFITAPIARLLGINDLIATTAEITEQGYTGNISGTPSFQAGKIERLNLWLKKTNLSMDGAWFYSDSHNDLPLLELVDNPVAVDPDDILKTKAQENNWKIISLR